MDEDSAYFEEDPCLRIVNINNVVSLHISDDNIVMCIDDNLSILNFVIPISDPECLTKIVDLIVI